MFHFFLVQLIVQKINFATEVFHIHLSTTSIPCLWASSHGGMKRSRDTDDPITVDRLFTGLVMGSVSDGRSAFSRVPPGTSCGRVHGIEVPVGDKNDDGRPVSVEVREDESGEGVCTESVVGEGVDVIDAKRGGGNFFEWRSC